MKTQRSKAVARPRMTEEEYASIKQVFDMDVPIQAVRKMTGRSRGTLSTIKRSTSYSNYCEIRDKWVEAHKAKHALEQPRLEVEAETPAQELPDDPAVVVLRSIDEKMGRMIELLETLNTRKRGIF